MFNLPKIGLDIGSASIKLSELSPAGKKWKLETMASMQTPANWMANAKTNLSATAVTLAKIYKEAGAHSKKVVVSIPEEQVFSHVIDLPLMSDEEVEQALQWQVEQYIPIPLDQAIWSHQIIRRDEMGNGGIEAMIVATPKSVVELYRQVVEAADLEVIAMETELMATARAALLPSSPLALVVDIGAKTTDMGLVQNGNLLFSRAIPTAGEAFTRAIKSDLGLENGQAEEYKAAYGFTSEHLEGKLAETMRPVLKLIADEIKKTISAYTSKHTGESVKFVTLSGGAAAMPDIVNQLSVQLGLEVALADPFANIILDESQKQAIGTTGPFYAVSVGLAMREV